MDVIIKKFQKYISKIQNTQTTLVGFSVFCTFIHECADALVVNGNAARTEPAATPPKIQPPRFIHAFCAKRRVCILPPRNICFTTHCHRHHTAAATACSLGPHITGRCFRRLYALVGEHALLVNRFSPYTLSLDRHPFCALSVTASACRFSTHAHWSPTPVVSCAHHHHPACSLVCCFRSFRSTAATRAAEQPQARAIDSTPFCRHACAPENPPSLRRTCSITSSSSSVSDSDTVLSIQASTSAPTSLARTLRARSLSRTHSVAFCVVLLLFGPPLWCVMLRHATIFLAVRVVKSGIRTKDCN